MPVSERVPRRVARVAVVVTGLALIQAVGPGMPSASPAGQSRAAEYGPSLPVVSSGQRPGPPLLYEPLPTVPELSVTAPFKAEPLLVSGTDAYRDGEYLYQDYLFDDHGANTTASAGVQPPAGDVRYPSAAHYAGNAADLVEFRVRPTGDALTYRITLNTVLRPDTAVVGIGIDRDLADFRPVAWPQEAGISSPGLDAFITARGTGGEVWLRGDDGVLGEAIPLPRGAVSMDLDTNQLTIRVPRRLPGMNPGTGSWRYVAGVGLWDGAHFVPVPPGQNATETTPASGSPLRGASAVFNLGFRFDEPQGVLGAPAHDTLPGHGHWFDEDQARALADGTTGRFFVDVDFTALAGGQSRWLHGPGRTQARIYPSSLPVPEGVHPSASPAFGGNLQPYLLHLPPASSRLPGLTLALHGNTASYTQYSAFSPNYLRQLGDDRNSLVLTPLGRDTRGAGTEREMFEAWRDVAHRFRFDPDRIALTGYSAGGYETYARAIKYPDLFGKAFAIVGCGRLGGDSGVSGVPSVSGDHTNYHPMAGNTRWVPFLLWNQAVDQLAPYWCIRLTQARFDELGLRSQLHTFLVGEHFTPALLDRWDGAADWLGDAQVTRDPARVDYAIAPVTWDAKAGRLTADHAYWVSGLRLREESARDETGTARGYLTAISRAFGEGDPITRRIVSVYPGPPSPATIDGTGWDGLRSEPRRNQLDVTLGNLRHATIDGLRARLDSHEPVTVRITSDGAATVTLSLPLPAGATITSPEDQPLASATLSREGAVFSVSVGSTVYVITPPGKGR